MMLKMYILVPYNLSPIQQGIQAGHAVIEFISEFQKTKGVIGENISTWINVDKTMIILNGGTSETMKEHLKYVESLGIPVSFFREPDLGNMITGICFLAEDGSQMTKYFTPLFRLA